MQYERKSFSVAVGQLRGNSPKKADLGDVFAPKCPICGDSPMYEHDTGYDECGNCEFFVIYWPQEWSTNAEYRAILEEGAKEWTQQEAKADEDPWEEANEAAEQHKQDVAAEQDEERILEAKIRRHRDLYYNSVPEISDREFDALKDRAAAWARGEVVRAIPIVVPSERAVLKHRFGHVGDTCSRCGVNWRGRFVYKCRKGDE